MHRAVPHELGVLQPRYHPEHAILLGWPELGLEPHEAVDARVRVLLPELNDRMRPPSRARVTQANRLHRAIRKRVPPPPRDHLHGQAALEVGFLRSSSRCRCAIWAETSASTNASYSSRVIGQLI